MGGIDLSTSPQSRRTLYDIERAYDLERNRRLLDQALLVVLLVGIGASCLLISAGRGVEAGHRPWRPGSLLKPVAELMALDYQFPTARGAEVKWLAQGLTAAAAVLAVTVAWFHRTRRAEDDPPPLEDPASPAQPLPARIRHFFSTLAPADAAMMAMLLCGGYALLSASWSPWPVGGAWEALRQLMLIGLTLAIGHGLTARGARAACVGLLGVLTLTAAIGVWYYLERNPEQRLKFPIGNPIFLAACLMPGICLAPALPVGVLASGRAGSAVRSGDNGPAWWKILLPFVAIVPLMLAFYLSGSRGPALGLAAGLGLMLLVVLPRRARAVTMLVAVLAMAVIWWFQTWPITWLTSRTDTARFRLYAWNYALDMFMSSPVAGRGQGAYMLMSQALSGGDAVIDPAAFPRGADGQKGIVEHAHSEWLEILADGGAFGFALTATAVGLTFWAAMVWLQRRPAAMNRWCMVGLLGAFSAILVEEATSVALRKPGLPIIYYGIWGLILALARSTPADEVPAQRTLGRPVRLLVGFAGTAVAVAIGLLAIRDWDGALAEHRARQAWDHRQWAQAFDEASFATQHRLCLEDRLLARFREIQIARAAIVDRSQQFQRMMAPNAPQADKRTAVSSLAGEDVAVVEAWASLANDRARELLSRIPHYPGVGSLLAESLANLQTMEVLLARSGLIPQPTSYQEDITKWLREAFTADRLNAEAGLGLFAASNDAELGDLLDMLRLPLRAGPMHAGVPRAMAALMSDPRLDPVLPGLIQGARASLRVSDWQSWPDPFPAETLRLAALAARLSGRPDQAAVLSRDAVMLADRVAELSPDMPAYVRMEEATYLLQSGAPAAEALGVLDACAEPAGGWRNANVALLMLRLRSLIHLASGNEAAAMAVLNSAQPRLDAQALRRNLGYGYAELAQMMLELPPPARPEGLEAWIQRGLELAPDGQVVLRVATMLAMERGDKQAATRHLTALAARLASPAELREDFEYLISRFPDADFLPGLYESLLQAPPQPASGPATLPAPGSPPMSGGAGLPGGLLSPSTQPVPSFLPAAP